MTQAGGNESHWLPDICFGEDQSCVRIGNAAIGLVLCRVTRSSGKQSQKAGR
jgi:hypothetical protein